MPFLKTFDAPNGATLTYHRVAKAEVSALGVEITVQSWPDEAAFLAGTQPLWNSRLSDYSQPALLASLEASLLQASGDFAGATYMPDTGTDLEIARVRQWAGIKAQREALDEAPIAVAGFEIDADTQSRQDVMGAIMAMQLTGATSRAWRCTDNVMRELTLEQLVSAGTGIAARRQALIEISAALYDQIQAAQTPAEVEAVVWPVGG